jgi:hypothetical protein
MFFSSFLQGKMATTKERSRIGKVVVLDNFEFRSADEQAEQVRAYL